MDPWIILRDLLADGGADWHKRGLRQCVEQLQTDFRRRCRRSDRLRKKNGEKLSGPAKDGQRHARGAINESIKMLRCVAGADVNKLSAAGTALARELVTDGAANLIHGRQFFEAGGITREIVERAQAPRN